MSDRLYIFDTTLRDGEQSPGCSMNLDEKLRVAHALAALGVDIIEAGFPVASPGDFEAVHRIASEVKGPTIAGLARAHPKDIERAAEAIKPAAHSRIHTFIATSPIHMQAKLRMSPDDVVEMAVAAVKQARSLAAEVEFSAEDAGRSEMDFLCRIVEATIAAGARVINIPDTVGYMTPNEFGARIKELRERVPNSDKAIFSVHCHNDLGLAVANSLNAVENGARQVECTINGLGERAGNAALEEIVMILRTRSDRFSIETCIDTTKIVPTSKLVSQITGMPVQPNKAIVGANAFAHESGIHQDGMLKHQKTYEIMTPESVGWTTNRMVLGKHSGRAALKSRYAELGAQLDGDALNAVFEQFKRLADKKKDIFDEDLMAILEQGDDVAAERIKLLSLHAASGTGDTPVAAVELEIEGKSHKATAEGDGPVDAAFKAIKSMVEPNGKLLLYQVNAITAGTDAQGEVTVRLQDGDRIVNGQGKDTDIVVASAKALIDALNKLPGMHAKEVHAQYSGV
ncbi:MAG: 2-isopropylmalate synthase [Zetaproteobacteria bacterium CG06_land_8_20_14_3_00_59_53]|nr:MAG: 2-isopropylmalate synthase [Zetaproteobacteria bacterium CG2_30_59_37]PIO89694.1 MAG: 2-isopropylmalate synthase [Zetaproteobacteria bacterium CG23_combo_of_CG06-09_8_20_14_all_59_86]PIQ65764.1 MAG: 2-isopropylmalate synthase [Zetaproteobacteria bacterium CG11_big_fil_rev_8_21_14_0_20_59_439]PIU70105.1 MAG: 2-isopropylmalate synthase [Zetaproteobacteria bacterium CG06_land_8_20_14_3_00_59_53]PIU96585.1 MAG: 2-isopropylmalate synthase [Zetaproteobacteria bacterium CG03_land_8_20_14_0_80_